MAKDKVTEAPVVDTSAQAEADRLVAEQKAREARVAELLEKEAKLEKIQNRERRYAIKIRLMVKKATAAGIKVSDEEIDAEIKRTGK